MKKSRKILARKRVSGSGSFGDYVRINRHQGVKLLAGDFYPTIKKAKESPCWEAAKREAYWLRRAHKSGVTPKCFGIDVFYIDGGYQVGIIMQHLGNTLLIDKHDPYGIKASDIVHGLMDDLEERAGLYHHDIHAENIMYHKGKYWLIDFSPDFIDEV